MTSTIEERIRYLKMELAASGRQDGYVLEGLTKELKRLEKKLWDADATIRNQK